MRETQKKKRIEIELMNQKFCNWRDQKVSECYQNDKSVELSFLGKESSGVMMLWGARTLRASCAVNVLCGARIHRASCAVIVLCGARIPRA